MRTYAKCWNALRGPWVLADLVVILLAVLTPANTARGQERETEGKRIVEATRRLHGLLEQAHDHGYRMHLTRHSLGGGMIKHGEEHWTEVVKVKMEEGKRYRVLAAGDHHATDIDVRIVSSAGKVVARDEGDDPFAAVNYTPKDTQEFSIQVRLSGSKTNQHCFCLAMVLSK